MILGRFLWLYMVPSCFFMVSGWFFLQNVPAQIVSWPDDPVEVRRPEGGIGPIIFKGEGNRKKKRESIKVTAY